MSNDKLLLSAIAGFAAGAIAGILLAPDKGSSTRKKIINKSEDFVDNARSQYSEFGNLLSELFENTRNIAEELANLGTSKYETLKKK